MEIEDEKGRERERKREGGREREREREKGKKRIAEKEVGTERERWKLETGRGEEGHE